MKGVFIFLFLCLSTTAFFAQSCDQLTLDSITDPGVYTVASLTESDGLRDGPDYAGATVYYPIDAQPPFASIAIVPGYVSPQSSIQDWGPFLASHGIVVMTIGTNSFFDDPYDRKDALLDAHVTLAEENSRIGSPLFGNLDAERIAVGGWSMGGGGAQLAAAADPTIDAVIALCPWLDTQTVPSDISHAAPLLIFSAELDAIAPPALHANVHYEYTMESTPKLIFEVDNAGHTVANGPTGGDDEVGQIALSWLKQYLIGDSCYCPLLLDIPSTASVFMTNVVCPDDPTSLSEFANRDKHSYTLYPSPTSGFTNLKVDNITDRMSYEIVSITGVRIDYGLVLNPTTRIDLQDIPAGLYYMNVLTSKYSETLVFIVK